MDSQEETDGENTEDETEAESFVCYQCDDQFFEAKPLFEHLVNKACLGYGLKMVACYQCGLLRS